MDSVTQYLVHIGYALMLFALVARDILWLRGMLVAAQSILSTYAAMIGVYSIASWNALFVVINIIWVARILHERRAVELPAELKPVYEKYFAALTAPEFLRLWSWGERKTVRDRQLTTHNEHPQALYFLLSGEVAIHQGDRELTRLPPGNFVGEMSLLTGKVATADVCAVGEVEYIEWPMQQLARVRKQNPILWTKIQSVLGHDLVEKIKRASVFDRHGEKPA